MKTHKPQGYIHRFLLLAIICLIAAIGLSSTLLKRVDMIIYDSLIKMTTESAPSEVVIIAIDEKSLSQIGRWPWSRQTHAELLNFLIKADTGPVGFDILFSEPENESSDKTFATAIEDHGNIVLAVAPEKSLGTQQIIELLPLTDLAIASRQLAHVDVELDLDGVSRKTFLYAGLSDPRWPALGLSLYQLWSENELAMPANSTVNASGWVRSTPMLIPYLGPAGQFKQYSYVDVLNGLVSPLNFTNKIILIGATAVGMGDAISTPVSGYNQRMPGVEQIANVTAALIQKRTLEELSSNKNLALTFIIALLIIPLSRALPVKLFPLSVVIAITCTVFISSIFFTQLRIWFPPATTLLLQLLLFGAIGWSKQIRSLNKIENLNHEVYQQLNFDSLTRLPNKSMLSEQISYQISEASNTPNKLAILMIQIGGLKQVNNRFGLDAGDRVLKMSAEMIQKAVSFKYPVARMGGLEFAILVNNQLDDSEVRHIGARLIQLLQRPCVLEDEQFFLSPCVGVSFYPDDGRETELLLSNASTAMYKAKADNKCDLYFYSKQLRNQIIEESSLERDLRQALIADQFEVYYQPQVVTGNGQIIGCEALLRWKHPERGFISPAEFIPVAEKTGLIIEIGDWVLKAACLQAAYWHRENNVNIRIAVNLSAIQFESGDLVEKVKDALNISQLPADLLELEVTETALMNDLDSTISALTELKSLGIQIALDDFGTGYSSLSHLKNFPLDRIKIDQSFVRDLAENSETAEITQAIISMAHSLNLKVIAEGVETPKQRTFLQSQTCEELQGFYFSRPLPARQVELLLSQKALGQVEDTDQTQ